MRKTTDKGERKYLVDREFNTFGRGAIEDAPAELLYGKGALAEAFNVNCYPQYFEGRNGSRVYSRAMSPAVKGGRASKDGDLVNVPYNERFSGWIRYLDWDGDALRDVVMGGAGALSGTDSSQVKVEGNAQIPWVSPNEWQRGDVALRGTPRMMWWHVGLKKYVRIEGGNFYVSDAPMDKWEHIPRVGWQGGSDADMSCSGIISFVPTKTGGFVYAASGIYRWVADWNNGKGKNEKGEVVRINTDAPLRARSEVDATGGAGMRRYRYLFTGVRLRGGHSRIDDPENTVVIYETPVFESDFLPDTYGLYVGRGKIVGNGAAVAVLSGLEWEFPLDRALTHIGVYRTLDLDAVDTDALNEDGTPSGAKNSPNRFALVADVPLLRQSVQGEFHVGNNYSAHVVFAPSDVEKVGELLAGRGASFRVRPDNYDTLPDYQKAAWDALRVMPWSDGNDDEALNMWIVGDIPAGITISSASGVPVTLWRFDDNDTWLPPFETYYDFVPDDVLRPRMREWYPRTRFRKPLPDCNIAAAAPGFVVCAIEGESNKLYYTADDSMGGYTWGSYVPTQVNEQVEDAVQHIEVFSDVVAIIGRNSTWRFPTGVVQYMKEPGSGEMIPHIPKIDVVDRQNGCLYPRTIRRISNGEIIMFTNGQAGAAVRVFNGYQYGNNMLMDSTLGLSRNKNRARGIAYAAAVYHESVGYIVWAALTAEAAGDTREWGDGYRTISEYCFRVAVLPEQGGGVSEYGGAAWLWPDADAASVVVGEDADGRGAVIVEDARTGHFFRIGIEEQWLDREDVNRAELDPLQLQYNPGYGEGCEIETRARLPIISDGYKWQKHLETHIAMRCWRPEYRGKDGYTPDGFRQGHTAGLLIYEDGEMIAEESALKDLNRNGDYAYLQKIDARRIQEVIETTTAAYKISRIVTKVQTSDREALPIDNKPVEVNHQEEWRGAVIHLSRNLPCVTYNRADGTEMEAIQVATGGLPIAMVFAADEAAPTGKPEEAFRTHGGVCKTLDRDRDGIVRDFSVMFWGHFGAGGRLVEFRDDANPAHSLVLGIADITASEGRIYCDYNGLRLFWWEIPLGVWMQVGWRRVITEDESEVYTLFINGEPVIEGGFSRAVQNGESDIADHNGPAVMGTFRLGPAYQNWWGDWDGGSDAGGTVIVGGGPGSAFFDVRVTLVGASNESFHTHYHATRRGGEGWLP